MLLFTNVAVDLDMVADKPSFCCNQQLRTAILRRGNACPGRCCRCCWRTRGQAQPHCSLGAGRSSPFPPRNPCRTLNPAATATKTHNGAKVLRDFCNDDSVRGKRVVWNARDHRIMPVWLRAQHIDCIVCTYEPVLLCTFASAGLDGIPSQSQSWS